MGTSITVLETEKTHMELDEMSMTYSFDVDTHQGHCWTERVPGSQVLQTAARIVEVVGDQLGLCPKSGKIVEDIRQLAEELKKEEES